MVQSPPPSSLNLLFSYILYYLIPGFYFGTVDLHRPSSRKVLTGNTDTAGFCYLLCCVKAFAVSTGFTANDDVYSYASMWTLSIFSGFDTRSANWKPCNHKSSTWKYRNPCWLATYHIYPTTLGNELPSFKLSNLYALGILFEPPIFDKILVEVPKYIVFLVHGATQISEITKNLRQTVKQYNGDNWSIRIAVYHNYSSSRSSASSCVWCMHVFHHMLNHHNLQWLEAKYISKFNPADMWTADESNT